MYYLCIVFSMCVCTGKSRYIYTWSNRRCKLKGDPGFFLLHCIIWQEIASSTRSEQPRNEGKCHRWRSWKKEENVHNGNKKHSENADNSTSVTFDLDLTSRYRKLMSLIVLCLGTRYDVCECNSLRDMTIQFGLLQSYFPSLNRTLVRRKTPPLLI